MITREDLESFLLRIGPECEEVEEGMWVLRGPENVAPVVVHYSPPVVLLRLKVLDLGPARDDARLAGFYRRLLELNANDIVHGSYGVEGSEVILSDALDLETLGFETLRSSYESLVLAASSHLPGLVELIPVAHEG
ncbi:MAG TPA: hypothetical protein VIL13_02380 [Longimicrobiales bacterium]|mgnify:CR=1 FL=1